MASAAVVSAGPCTDVLREPFDNLALWTSGGGATIVSGRTGTAAQIIGTNALRYTIPAISESATITFGFAFKIDALPAQRLFCQLTSDADTANHTTFQVNTNGSIQAQLGGTTGTVIGTSATGVVVVNTWAYVEIQVTMHDTAGVLKLTVNGTSQINVSGIDTKFGGTKTTFDTVRLHNSGAGATVQFDDFYLSSGSGCTFKGDQTVVNTGPDVLLDPFNNLTAWTVTGTPTGIVAGGRTGTAAEFASFSSAFLRYSIPVANQLDTVTIGFAWRPATINNGEYKILGLKSDAGATDHNTLAINSTNALVFYRSSSGLQTSAAAVIPTAATYYYIEVQAKLHDTLGTFEVRVNGTTVLGPATNQDTRNAGTKTVYDTIELPPGGLNGSILRYDDLYITMGAGAPFKGSITIP